MMLGTGFLIGCVFGAIAMRWSMLPMQNTLRRSRDNWSRLALTIARDPQAARRMAEETLRMHREGKP